jgi:molybdenum-dependent DNA-binding transcriptional regulator ModE
MYDPTRLAALVAVAEAGSITRAAARLGYTAPALSQQVAKLEREAGAVLVVRSHRGARLTAAGELLAERARRVLDETTRRLEPASFRRTISVAHRGEDSGPAVRSLRALLRGAFGRAGARPGPAPQ